MFPYVAAKSFNFRTVALLSGEGERSRATGKHHAEAFRGDNSISGILAAAGSPWHFVLSLLKERDSAVCWRELGDRFVFQAGLWSTGPPPSFERLWRRGRSRWGRIIAGDRIIGGRTLLSASWPRCTNLYRVLPLVCDERS